MFNTVFYSKTFGAFARDRNASISILAAASITVVASISALSLEFGRLYLEKRKQQAATDLAAIAAAAYPGDPKRAAGLVLQRNGIDPQSIESVRTGVYLAREGLPVEQRFSTVSANGVPAAELKLSRKVPFIFAGLISKAFGSDTVTISTRAVGASNAEAAFSVGSKLAVLDGGVANQVLGAMLGTNIGLSVMDYEALANANVKMFGFFDALATRASIKAVTYDELLEREFDLPAVFGAISDTGDTNAGAQAALSKLAANTSGQAKRVRFKDWISLGSLGSRAVGTPLPDESTVNVLEMVSTTARIAAAGKLISLDLTGNMPTGTGATVHLAVGEPKQYSGFVRVGSPNSIVETAQTRLLFVVNQSVIGLPSLVKLPLYVEAASGKARLTATSCAAGKSAALAVRPSLVSARIADVDEKDMSKFNKSMSSEPVAILNTPLVKISAYGAVEMTNSTDREVRFSNGDISGNAVKTVATEETLTTLLVSLISNTEINVSGLSVPGLVPGTALKKAVSAIVPTLDKALTTVLTLAGVKVGAVDVQVQGVRCNNASLVR
jgi:uncharacterized membrane protein